MLGKWQTQHSPRQKKRCRHSTDHRPNAPSIARCQDLDPKQPRTHATSDTNPEWFLAQAGHEAALCAMWSSASTTASASRGASQTSCLGLASQPFLQQQVFSLSSCPGLATQPFLQQQFFQAQMFSSQSHAADLCAVEGAKEGPWLTALRRLRLSGRPR